MGTISKVCVVGAGFMGQVISLRSACCGGYDVVVYDNSPEAIASAPTVQGLLGELMIATHKLDRESFDRGRARIRFTSDAREAAAGASLLSESVPEALDTKRSVHAEFERLLPVDALITTNTSYLRPSDIEGALLQPERFAALHFHGLGGSLVDVMAGTRTSRATIDALREFALSIGEYPMIMPKEHSGYLYNAMLGSLLATAVQLVVEGCADAESVDKAYMAASGQPHGPFAIMDAVGLDVTRAALGTYLDARTPFTRAQLEAFLAPYLAAGRKGFKSGAGFYSYPHAEYLKADFLKP